MARSAKFGAKFRANEFGCLRLSQIRAELTQRHPRIMSRMFAPPFREGAPPMESLIIDVAIVVALTAARLALRFYFTPDT
jgi:hypothetical protein